MLGGKGFYRGSSILVSGTAGSGKTTLAAKFLEASCKRKERSLYFAFEESPEQIIRNMKSVGIDLENSNTARLAEISRFATDVSRIGNASGRVPQFRARV